LNSYKDKCRDIIKTLDNFSIDHIAREENKRANSLAQQDEVVRGVFMIKEQSEM
jgi:hypothetical protein